MSDNEAKPKRPNRKRKKSFLKNARKYAKKGYFGRGSHMEEDTYQYFVRIMEAYREGFENDEDKLIFVNNVFEQTENKEIDVSCNQLGCRVIEMLLPFANDQVLDRFMTAFSDDLRPLCSDRFATHVLEALVTHSCTRSLDPSKSDEETRTKFKLFTFKISKFLLNNLEDYIWDTYGNHVLRTCLQNLAQLPKEEEKKGKKVQATIKSESGTIPEDYTEIVQDYAERLITWPQFNELCHTEITSGFLQVLLKALRKINLKLLKRYLTKLVSDVFSPETNEEIKTNPAILPAAFQSKPVMMLLETALQLAKSKTFTQIYANCFAGRLLKLATTRTTNFAVQKLLLHVSEKAEFEAMFDELADSLRDILAAGHSGVVLAMAQTCKRLGAKQGSFVQSLLKAMDCAEPDERQNAIVLCMCRLQNYASCVKVPNENLQKESLNLHGALILQEILEFNKPIKVVNSLLSMEAGDLKNLFSNTMGSHLVDSYVTSAFVGEKSREKLVRRMKGFHQELASSKFGSRSFEAIWNAATFKNKTFIMEELAYKDGAWANTEHGKIIAGKVNLVLYKRNKEDWKNSFNKVQKAEDVFADVLK